MTRCVMVLALALYSGSALAADEATPKADNSYLVGFVGGVASRAYGDVPLDIGPGLDMAFGFRDGPVTLRIVVGGSTHHIANGGSLVLGDSVTVEKNWDITWLGFDGQYSFRQGHKGLPFVSVRATSNFLTHDGDNNVEGFQLGAGGGYEYVFHQARIMLSVWSSLQVEWLRVSHAKVKGEGFELPEPIEDTVVSLKLGIAVYE